MRATCLHKRAHEGYMLYGGKKETKASVTIGVYCPKCRARIGVVSWNKRLQKRVTHKQPWADRPYTDPSRQLKSLC